MILSDPKGVGPECNIAPLPPGPRIDDSEGAQGFSDGHGRGHGYGKNINNHRAKTRSLVATSAATCRSCGRRLAIDNGKVSIDTPCLAWHEKPKSYNARAWIVSRPSRGRPTVKKHEGDVFWAVICAAKKALSRGDGWLCEPAHYDRLRANCEALGVSGEVEITVALRSAISEITIQDMQQREDTSYAGFGECQKLYVCVWDSAHFKRRMYWKFAMNEELMEVFTFHESFPGSTR